MGGMRRAALTTAALATLALSATPAKADVKLK